MGAFILIDRMTHQTVGAGMIRTTNERLDLGANSSEVFSGHSMRVGAAQDLLEIGFDIAAIMRAGGWKSVDTVSRYLEMTKQNVWI